MIKLTQIELLKLFRQKKSWVSFIVFTLIVLLIQGGLYLEGQTFLDLILQNFKDHLFIYGNIINGYLISYIALNTLWIHIPVLLVIVTADVVSGEINSGTVRLMLTGTISRTSFIMAKSLAVLVYVFVFMLFMAVITLVPSIIIFGQGDLLVFSNDIQVLLQSEVLFRFVLSFAYGTLSMFCFAALSILCSVVFKNTLTAILVTLGILVVSTLLQSFGYGIFETLQPYLFTYHMTQWQLFFVREIPVAAILNSAIFLFVMSIVALGIARLIFTKTQLT